MLKIVRGVLFFTIFLGISTTTLAQLDYTETSNYGTYTISRSDDDVSVSMTSGGSESVSSFLDGSDCRGYVTEAPDVQINVTSSTYTHLRFEFESTYNEDTTMVVRSPDGLYYCDDDDGDGLDAMIYTDDSETGYWDVWVGSYSRGDYHQGILTVTAYNIRPYALVCITNETNHSINFGYRWGDSGSWSDVTLAPDRAYRFWWTYDEGSRNSPEFNIRFDENLTSYTYWRYYDLERYAVPSTDSCNAGRQYHFDYVGSSTSRVDLYDSE